MRGGRVRLPVTHVEGTRRPLKVNFITNYSCNLDCTYCGTHELPKAMMSPPQLCAAIDAFAALGMQQANFIGGEPFLRKDLPDALARVKSHGAATVVHSNGIFERALPAAAFESLDVFHTCLNGRKAAHEASRGRDTYESAVASIELMRSKDVAVRADMIVSSSNCEVEEVEHVFAMARRLGFRVNFQPVFEHQLVAATLERIGAMRVASERVQALFQYLRERYDPVVMYNSTAYLESLGRGQIPSFEHCWMGWVSFTVDPLGNVSRCYKYVRAPENPNGFAVGWAEAVASVPLSDCRRCEYSNHAEDNYLLRSIPVVATP